MEFIFSTHAREQMHERKIIQQIIIQIINQPDEIVTQSDLQVFQGLIKENGKSYLIRIFVNVALHPNLIITVYKTSKISKYYEGEI
ncbi:MAG: DUF4258 domain-containing protein [Chitinophagales bacterium]|nr:DUF4258 domain-containing protein [Chitinophagales bacterium]